MVDEKVMLQVLAEQKEEVERYKTAQWVNRREENLFEFDSPLAQVVIGVRRSGKSTLCHKVLKDHGVRYGYANIDDDRLAGMEVGDLNLLLSCLYQIYGTDVPYLFFDEIQNVEGWELFINRLLRNQVRVFVTGSNARLLSSELATHLTGRYNEICLYPFSFAEYCAFHGIDTTGITTKAEADRKRALFDYLNDGGFPEMQRLRNKRSYIQGLIEAVVQKDIRNRYKVRNVEVLRSIANHFINNTCQVANFDELASVLGVSDKTVKRYLDYLQQAFLLRVLPRHSFKSKERITGEKVYVIDVGMENNRANSMAAENVGWRMENVVYIELLRRCSFDFLDVYYYRPNSRAKEVDFVVCSRNKAQELIQVAYDVDIPKVMERETSALVRASEALGCDNLTLVAFTESRTVEVDGKSIRVCSLLDWLLK